MIMLVTHNDEIVLETCVVPDLVRKTYFLFLNGNVVKQ